MPKFTSSPKINAILTDPNTSQWLRQATLKVLARDDSKAIADVQCLAEALMERAELNGINISQKVLTSAQS